MKNFKLKEGKYIPQTGIDYPTDNPMTRLVPVKIVRDCPINENYPFIDNSFSFKIKRHFVCIVVASFVLRLVNKIKYGMKYDGRDILKKYKKEFKKGLISVSNHCYPIDAVAISNALRHRLWLPMLPDLFSGSNWWLLTYFGGIPVPDDISAMKKFNEAFDYHNSRSEWIHVFPEARSWRFYKPLRPFKKGAFTMAYRFGCPVLPMCIDFRERKGIYKLFGSQKEPLITVRIGEPIFPDTTAPRKTEVVRILELAHKRVCELGGIEENPWPAMMDD